MISDPATYPLQTGAASARPEAGDRPLSCGGRFRRTHYAMRSAFGGSLMSVTMWNQPRTLMK